MTDLAQKSSINNLIHKLQALGDGSSGYHFIFQCKYKRAHNVYKTAIKKANTNCDGKTRKNVQFTYHKNVKRVATVVGEQ